MLRIRDRHTGVVQSVHPPPGSPATRTRDVIGPRRRAVARRMFADRKDAGSQLAQRIAHRSFDRPVVYALARGGLPVAAEVAGRLGAPLDVILVRKLGAPGQPELAIGAVADGHDATVVLHENIVQQLGISPTGITAATDRAFAEIRTAAPHLPRRQCSDSGNRLHSDRRRRRRRYRRDGRSSVASLAHATPEALDPGDPGRTVGYCHGAR